MGLMEKLLSSRPVTQLTQIQPVKATVGVQYTKEWATAEPTGIVNGSLLGVSRDILTAPVWGATTPNAFIQINGQIPKAPIVSDVAAPLGSNAPVGGKC